MTDLQREILETARAEIIRHLAGSTRTADYLLGVAVSAMAAALTADDFNQGSENE